VDASSAGQTQRAGGDVVILRKERRVDGTNLTTGLELGVHFGGHHTNHVHFDNRPENLVAIDTAAHSRYHRKVGHQFRFQAVRIAGIHRLNLDPARQAQLAEVSTRNIRAYMDNSPEHFREATAGDGRRGAGLIRFNTSPQACGECDHEAANPAALRWHVQREHGHNHKVIEVKAMTETADV